MAGGDDRVTGSSGNDNLKGGPGDDRLFGGDGKDIAKGGPGLTPAGRWSSGRAARCPPERAPTPLELFSGLATLNRHAPNRVLLAAG